MTPLMWINCIQFMCNKQHIPYRRMRLLSCVSQRDNIRGVAWRVDEVQCNEAGQVSLRGFPCCTVCHVCVATPEQRVHMRCWGYGSACVRQSVAEWCDLDPRTHDTAFKSCVCDKCQTLGPGITGWAVGLVCRPLSSPHQSCVYTAFD
jgi:hypothetical protein